MRRTAAVAILTLAAAACQPAAARVEATYRFSAQSAGPSICAEDFPAVERAVAHLHTYTVTLDVDGRGCAVRVRMDEGKQAATRYTMEGFGYVLTSTTRDSMTGGAR